MVDTKRITARRRELGLTQEAVAERIGIGRAYYSHIETGRQPDPPLSIAFHIAEVLQMDVAEMWRE